MPTICFSFVQSGFVGRRRNSGGGGGGTLDPDAVVDAQEDDGGDEAREKHAQSFHTKTWFHILKYFQASVAEEVRAHGLIPGRQHRVVFVPREDDGEGEGGAVGGGQVRREREEGDETKSPFN